MTNDDREKRPSKFSDADLRTYLHSRPGPSRSLLLLLLAPENDPPLADLLEHAIRGSGLHERARLDEGTPGSASGASEPDLLHERLIEELTTAQKQMRAERLPNMKKRLSDMQSRPRWKRCLPNRRSLCEVAAGLWRAASEHRPRKNLPAQHPLGSIRRRRLCLDLIPPARPEDALPRTPAVTPRKAGEAQEQPAAGVNLRSQAHELLLRMRQKPWFKSLQRQPADADAGLEPPTPRSLERHSSSGLRQKHRAASFLQNPSARSL